MSESTQSQHGSMTMQDMNREANEILDQDVEATRRMRNLVHQDVDTANKTMQMLDEQGHQLERVEDNLDGIDANTKKAEHELTKMEKCCGIFYCPCAKRHNFERDNTQHGRVFKQRNKSSSGGDGNGGEAGGVITQQPMSARGAARGGQEQGSDGRYIEPILQGDAREEEMDDNMKMVSSGLSVLKQQAMAMNDELDSQNETLERLDQKTELDTKRVKQATDRTVALLK